MLLTEYETTLVVRPDVSVEAIEATLDRVRESVRGLGGKLLAINHWGKKKLAYPIMKQTRGIYVHTQYLGDGKVVSEIERNLRIAENVLRYLTVMVEHDVDPTTRTEKEYLAPRLDAEEAVAADEHEHHHHGHAGDDDRRDSGDDHDMGYGDRHDADGPGSRRDAGHSEED